MIWNHNRIFLQRFKRQLHGLFELRVMPRRNGGRIVFHFNIWRNAVVFHLPFAV